LISYETAKWKQHPCFSG